MREGLNHRFADRRFVALGKGDQAGTGTTQGRAQRALLHRGGQDVGHAGDEFLAIGLMESVFEGVFESVVAALAESADEQGGAAYVEYRVMKGHGFGQDLPGGPCGQGELGDGDNHFRGWGGTKRRQRGVPPCTMLTVMPPKIAGATLSGWPSSLVAIVKYFLRRQAVADSGVGGNQAGDDGRRTAAEAPGQGNGVFHPDADSGVVAAGTPEYFPNGAKGDVAVIDRDDPGTFAADLDAAGAVTRSG